MGRRRGSGDLGYRAGVALGLVKPSRGPRPWFARVAQAGVDSSRGELVAGVVLTAVEVALMAALAFTGPLWHRLLTVLPVLLLGNLVQAGRLLLRRGPAGQGPSSPR